MEQLKDEAMKFQAGDETDTAHCIALTHEILRCEEAFKDFEKLATQSIMVGENRPLAFKMYNAYARFLHHLYEFMAGCYVRDRQDTDSGFDTLRIEHHLMHHAQRIVNNRRQAIINGTAPSWENALGAYPEKVPEDFAKDFRLCRNKAAGHVKHQRADLSLSDFYDRYHMYLYLLYRDALAFWGNRGREFPDLKEITDFTIAIRQQPPSPAP
jgi:hypothetical protein